MTGECQQRSVPLEQFSRPDTAGGSPFGGTKLAGSTILALRWRELADLRGRKPVD